MSVGVLIITHRGIGKALLDTAIGLLGRCPLPTEILNVSPNGDAESLHGEAVRLMQQVNRGSGVLVLTDLYGSTPSNLSATLKEFPDIRIISGINLPMLIKIFNYPNLELEMLQQKALSGGRESILSFDNPKREQSTQEPGL